MYIFFTCVFSYINFWEVYLVKMGFPIETLYSSNWCLYPTKEHISSYLVETSMLWKLLLRLSPFSLFFLFPFFRKWKWNHLKSARVGRQNPDGKQNLKISQEEEEIFWVLECLIFIWRTRINLLFYGFSYSWEYRLLIALFGIYLLYM